LLGRLLLDQGQPREALSQLKRATEIDAGLANAYYALYQAQQQLGDADAAKKTLETFQQLKQKEKAAMDKQNSAYDNDQLMRGLTADFHSEAGKLLSRQGKTTLAEAHLQQAIRVAPQEPRGYETLGEFYIKQSRLQQARKVFEDLVRLRPNQVGYRVNISTLLLQLKDYAAAVKELKLSLELDPNEPTALKNLAQLYLNTHQDLPEALALCQRLVAIEPAAANYGLLGAACYQNGKTNEAIEATAKALEKDPSNPVYSERLRRLRKSAGERQ